MAKAKNMDNVKIQLSDRQIKIGTIYMTMSNLGWLSGRKFKDENDLMNEWQQCRMAYYPEGIELGDGDEEYESWKRMMIKKDKFTIETLQKEIPHIFNE